ncbi:MAG: UDP-N-acetylmuramate:L-alanyl-gamma-D-glutamyl-meso-diaminopimelate ligase [Deltaproteobacteria bacterium]|nr:UDP-N-acetylmuramate:L-alanyl-gamma-D-glutamyl-meso-diaminopimelate ligase [Deltaproteobacteria bacterium]
MKTIHLVAACGTAMGSLAGILKQKGYNVTGSDQNVYPPMSTQLEAIGVKLMNGYKAENLAHKPDLVVIGNAIRKDNPEARAAIDGGMKYVSFTDALAEYFLAGKAPIVIGGTHGKTTTTSLMAQVLIAAGQDPSVFVGGIAQNLGGSFRIGQGPYAVLEGDEYDTAFFDKTPKFWHYLVRHALVTHLEYDHADIYASIEAVEAAFAKFITLVPADGTITVCASAPRLMKQLGGAKAPVESYSVHVPADWTIANLRLSPDASSFDVLKKGVRIGEFRVPMVGMHNIENALGVIAVTVRLGLAPESVAQGLKGFAGVKRRLEIRGEVNGVAVVDDFAHHPTAVKATVGACRQKFQDRRIIAIFEPRSQTSRRKVFQREYELAFDGAAAAFIMEPFGTDSLKPEERFEPSDLAASLRERGIDAHACKTVEDIVSRVRSIARPHDVVLVMSNGGFGGIHDKLLAALAV